MNRKCSDVNLSIVHGFLPCKELFYFTKQNNYISVVSSYGNSCSLFFFLLFFSCSLLSDFHYIRVISFFLQCFGTLGFILYLPTQFILFLKMFKMSVIWNSCESHSNYLVNTGWILYLISTLRVWIATSLLFLVLVKICYRILYLYWILPAEIRSKIYFYYLRQKLKKEIITGPSLKHSHAVMAFWFYCLSISVNLVEQTWFASSVSSIYFSVFLYLFRQ